MSAEEKNVSKKEKIRIAIERKEILNILLRTRKEFQKIPGLFRTARRYARAKGLHVVPMIHQIALYLDQQEFGRVTVNETDSFHFCRQEANGGIAFTFFTGSEISRLIEKLDEHMSLRWAAP